MGKTKNMSENLKDFIGEKTPEELENIRNWFEIQSKDFEIDVTQWQPLNKHSLPQCRAIDLFSGGTPYEFRKKDGTTVNLKILDPYILLHQLTDEGFIEWRYNQHTCL